MLAVVVALAFAASGIADAKPGKHGHGHKRGHAKAGKAWKHAARHFRAPDGRRVVVLPAPRPVPAPIAIASLRARSTAGAAPTSRPVPDARLPQTTRAPDVANAPPAARTAARRQAVDEFIAQHPTR
ncbi:hypothetical protein [Lysobacter humi (ex Lee et al. 2017)]